MQFMIPVGTEVSLYLTAFIEIIGELDGKIILNSMQHHQCCFIDALYKWEYFYNINSQNVHPSAPLSIPPKFALPANLCLKSPICCDVVICAGQKNWNRKKKKKATPAYTFGIQCSTEVSNH